MKPTAKEIKQFTELWLERERIMDEENNLAKMRANKRFKDFIQSLPVNEKEEMKK